MVVAVVQTRGTVGAGRFRCRAVRVLAVLRVLGSRGFRVSRAYGKAHTPPQRPSVSNGGMDHDASLSPPRRRTRRIALISLAILGMASAVFVVRRPLMMSAPTCMAGRWHGCFDTFNGVVLMTLVSVPLAALVAWALARRRRSAGVSSAWRTSLAEVGMVHGTVPFLWLTMMPGAEAGTVPGGLSLVPLRDLLTMGPLGSSATCWSSRRWGSSPRCGSRRWPPCRGSWRSGRAARSWSKPHSTSCHWTGCRPWTTYWSTPPAPRWPRWRRVAGGAPRSKRRRSSPAPRRHRQAESRVRCAHLSLHTPAICCAA